MKSSIGRLFFWTLIVCFLAFGIWMMVDGYTRDTSAADTISKAVANYTFSVYPSNGSYRVACYDFQEKDGWYTFYADEGRETVVAKMRLGDSLVVLEERK